MTMIKPAFVLVAALVLPMGEACAQAATDFYAGKQISLLVGTTAGGIPVLFTCSLFTSSMFTSSVSTGPVTGEVTPPRRESWSD